MNIFITDYSPIQSAINLDDKRVKHMPKESIECLGVYIHFVTNNWVIPFPLWGDIDRNEPLFLYNHPVTKWVRKDRANVWWLYQHTLALFKEHQYRFDTINPVQRYMSKIEPFMIETDKKPKSFQNSSLYKQLPIIEAYRATMINKWTVTDKVKPVTFTKRGKPDWFI